jgi:hypothetical protein
MPHAPFPIPKYPMPEEEVAYGKIVIFTTVIRKHSHQVIVLALSSARKPKPVPSLGFCLCTKIPVPVLFFGPRSQTYFRDIIDDQDILSLLSDDE